MTLLAPLGRGCMLVVNFLGGPSVFLFAFLVLVGMGVVGGLRFLRSATYQPTPSAARSNAGVKLTSAETLNFPEQVSTLGVSKDDDSCSRQ